MEGKTSKPLTVQDTVAFLDAKGSKSQKKGVRKAKAAFAIHGIGGPDFDCFPADLKNR